MIVISVYLVLLARNFRNVHLYRLTIFLHINHDLINSYIFFISSRTAITKKALNLQSKYNLQTVLHYL